MPYQNKFCPACCSEQFAELIAVDKTNYSRLKDLDINYYDGLLSKFPKDIALLNCDYCRHIFFKYYPDSDFLDQMYKSHNKLRGYSNALTTDNSSKELLLRRLQIIFRAKNFLDFGSGNGSWSKLASNFFDVVAYDPHSSRSGVDIDSYMQISSIEEIVDKKFDIIFCNQMLEHLSHPFEELEMIRALCHENTLLYISVPNVGRVDLSSLTEQFPHPKKGMHLMSPFQHLQGYSQKSLELLLSRAGFKKINILKLFRFSPALALRSILGKRLSIISTTTMFYELS